MKKSKKKKNLQRTFFSLNDIKKNKIEGWEHVISWKKFGNKIEGKKNIYTLYHFLKTGSQQ